MPTFACARAAASLLYHSAYQLCLWLDHSRYCTALPLDFSLHLSRMVLTCVFVAKVKCFIPNCITWAINFVLRDRFADHADCIQNTTCWGSLVKTLLNDLSRNYYRVRNAHLTFNKKSYQQLHLRRSDAALYKIIDPTTIPGAHRTTHAPRVETYGRLWVNDGNCLPLVDTCLSFKPQQIALGCALRLTDHFSTPFLAKCQFIALFCNVAAPGYKQHDCKWVCFGLNCSKLRAANI